MIAYTSRYVHAKSHTIGRRAQNPFPFLFASTSNVNRHACSPRCNKAFVRQPHALVLMDSGDEDTHINRRVRLKRKDLRCDRLNGQGSVLRYAWLVFQSGCTHKLQCTQLVTRSPTPTPRPFPRAQSRSALSDRAGALPSKYDGDNTLKPFPTSTVGVFFAGGFTDHASGSLNAAHSARTIRNIEQSPVHLPPR